MFGEQVNPAPQGGGGGTAAGILTGVAGIYDTYQSSKTAKYNTDSTIAANSREAQLAYEREIEMWNRMNAYNDPSAQMARYAAAGLNPHMVGQSGTGSGNTNTMPKYNPPNIAYKYEAPQAGDALQSILPIIMQVGTWMQSMKFSEEQIKGQQISNIYKTTQDEKAKQAIDYLEGANPELLSTLKAKKRLLNYQGSTESYRTNTQQWLEKAAYGKILAEYGSDFAQLDRREGNSINIGGYAYDRGRILKNQSDISSSKATIERANASYADYGITNPQALINLVVGSALSGVKGGAVRINQGARKYQDTRTYKQKYESIRPRYRK